MRGNEDEGNAGHETARPGPAAEPGETGDGAGVASGQQGEAGQPKSAAAKWGVAGVLLFYVGVGGYCVASAFGYEVRPEHPAGVTRSVAAALARPAAGTSDAEGARAFASKAPAARPAAGVRDVRPSVEVLTAVRATAVGPQGANDGDHPQLAQLVLDPRTGTSWLTHWYASAHFGNLKNGTGLLLDMGRLVTIRQVQLSLAGSPGFWGADLEIRVGATPDLESASPVAVASDVGGWVSASLDSPAEGRYLQIWFTKLPLDSWGTYQEHVYGITVHGSVPAPPRAARRPGVPPELTTHPIRPARRGAPGAHHGRGNDGTRHGHSHRGGSGSD